MRKNVLTEEEFLKSVEKHEIYIMKDDPFNLDRHIKCRIPGTYNMSFDIITWQGHLCFTGDMGTFVFSRIPDMLSFFRDKGTGPLEINPQYWAEKVLAEDKNGGIEKFSPDTFESKIKEILEDFIKNSKEDDVDNEIPAEEYDNLRTDVECDVLYYAHDGEYAAYNAARNFRYDYFDFEFRDFWETNCKEYNYHYLWCCYAIVWCIRKYDAMKAAKV